MLVLAAFGASAFPEAVIDTRPDCDIAADWARSHAQSLPNSLESLAAFPTAYRRAIVAALPPTTRLALAQQYLATTLAEPSLSAEQRSAVAALASSLTPQWFSAPRSALFKAVAANWQGRLVAAFPASEFDRRFIKMNMSDDGYMSTDTWAIFLGRAMAATGRVLAIPRCNCRSDSNFTCGSGPLGPRICGCSLPCNPNDGCGFLGLFECDGMCGYP